MTAGQAINGVTWGCFMGGKFGHNRGAAHVVVAVDGRKAVCGASSSLLVSSAQRMTDGEAVSHGQCKRCLSWVARNVAPTVADETESDGAAAALALSLSASESAAAYVAERDAALAEWDALSAATVAESKGADDWQWDAPTVAPRAAQYALPGRSAAIDAVSADRFRAAQQEASTLPGKAVSDVMGMVAWFQAHDASGELADVMFRQVRAQRPAPTGKGDGGQRAVHAAGTAVTALGWDVWGDRITDANGAAESVRIERVETSGQIAETYVYVCPRWVDGATVHGESAEACGCGESVTGNAVSVTFRVRLMTGSASYGVATGTATGALTELRNVRSEAREAARKAARAQRAAFRSGDGRAIGSDAVPAVSLRKLSDGMPGAAGISGDDFRALAGHVMRHAYGNAQRTVDGKRAGSASAAQYVRAGYATSGIAVDPWVTDDARQNAALWVIRWLTDGLPEALAQRLGADDAVSADDGDAQRRRHGLLSAAAQNGLRDVTRQPRNAQTARTRAYASKLGNVTATATDDAGTVRVPVVMREIDARVGYPRRIRTARDAALASRVSLRKLRGNPVMVTVTNGGAPVGRAASKGKGYVTSGVPGSDVMARVFSRVDSYGAALGYGVTVLAYPFLAALALSGSGGRAESLADVALTLYGNAGGAARKRVRAACAAEWAALSDTLALSVATAPLPGLDDDGAAERAPFDALA